MSKEVFISYSTDDTAVAEQIRDGLESGDGDVSAISCWMAPRDIVPGREYAEQILDAIEACSVMVLLVSQTSNQSRFVRSEVERAVSKDKVIIPVRIHEVTLARSLEFFISSAQWIDALDGLLTAELEALTSAIRGHLQTADTAALDAVSPPPAHPLTPSSTPRHNLPAQTTAFVGRDKELSELNRMLAEPSTRLITIVGPGGMGKTRLALAAAARQLPTEEPFDNGPTKDNQAKSAENRFPNGIFFVPLAPLSEAEQIAPTIADALGMVLDGGGQNRTLIQQLAEYLKTRQLLLVLDNYEHILAGADLVSLFLQTAPAVQILVTSRERLHLQEEQIFPIEGLEFPDWETPADAAEYTAVRLFVQSARRVQPGFALVESDLTHLTRICRLVAGSPLALELAAGWVELFSLAEIADEIQRSLDFLESEMRNVPERHRSMRAVFDYSWQRLSQSERDAAARLTVFRGGFDRQAAQEVVGASIRTLASLVSKSLLQTSVGHQRYHIHELVRQYAAQELAKVPQQELSTRDHHARYFAELLHQQESRLKGGEQQTALATIEANQDNMRAAWHWAIEQGDIELVDRAMWSLGYFYENQGRYQEGADIFEKAVLLTNRLDRLLVMVRAYLWQSTFHRRLAELERSQQLLDRCAESLQSPELTEVDLRPEEAMIDFYRGRLEMAAGNGQESIRLYKASLVGFRELGDRWNEAMVMIDHCWALRNLGEIGTIDQRQSQLNAAETTIRQSLAICRELGDSTGIGQGLIQHGFTFTYLGDLDRAYDAFEEGLAFNRASGNQAGIAMGLFGLGATLVWKGQYDRALILGQQALDVAEEIGFFYQIGPFLYLLGWASTLAGDHEQAQKILLRSVETARDVEIYHELALSLSFLAMAEQALGLSEAAWRRLAESLQIGVEIRSFFAIWLSATVMIHLLLDRGDTLRSVELYAFLSSFTGAVHWNWLDDWLGRRIRAVASELDRQVVAAAEIRGRQRNLLKTAVELLAEIEEWT